MNNREATNYIEELGYRGSKPGLDRVRELCSRLDNPQNDLRFIHVAGTNGKGSVCSYISNILVAAGIKTGCFSSPAVFEYRERYRIQGRNVSQAALCRSLEVVKAAADAMEAEGFDAPTQFEVETALAFHIFREAGCEIVVLECGMGGETDSTNIIESSLVSVITSVSMDHTAQLGRTIDAITRQKAGIIKAKGHVVTIEQRSEVINAIKAKASLAKADLTIVGRNEIKNVRWGIKSSSFEYGKHGKLKITMAGKHQTDNAAIAVAAIDALRKERIKIDDKAIKEGLETTAWKGRFEIIARNPLFIIDGAHNEDAARVLSESIEFYLHNEEEAGKLIFIFGVFADKDYDTISKIMAPHAAHVITITPPNNARALPAEELAVTVSKYQPMVSAASSITEALEMAYLLADNDSVIISFGSLSFLGEISRLVAERGTTLRRKETRI